MKSACSIGGTNFSEQSDVPQRNEAAGYIMISQNGGGALKMTKEMIRADRGPGVFSGCEGKYLTFSLAGEEYGIGIKKVKEIIGTMPIRSIPQTPSHLKGVINLRGKVIPVV